MSEYILELFLNYLLDIGMIDLDTGNQLNEIFLEIIYNDSNIDFQNAMYATLMIFLNNMSEEQQKFTSFNLIIRFFEKNLLERANKLKNIFFIISKLEKLKLYKYLNKWKMHSINKTINLSFSQSKNQSYKKTKPLISLYKSNSLSRMNNKKENSQKKNSLIKEASWITKEKESLSHCTFNPSINKNKNRLNSQPNVKNGISVFDRLYEYNQKYSAKKQIKQVEYDNIKSNELTFQPLKSISSNNFYFRNRNKDLNFEERQKNFIENKKKNKNKIENELNDDFHRECYFNPKIYEIKKDKIKSGYEINIPAYKRLYNDVERRRNKNQNINNKINDNLIQHSNSCVDYNKIDELYNDYKIKNGKRKKIKEKIEFEEGLTFHPYVNKNNIYYNKIKNDFFERNNQFIDSKNKFIQDNQIKEEEKLNQDKIEFKNRKYSPLEKEEITKRIIERLYGDKNKSFIIKNNNNHNNYEEQKNFIQKNNTNYF